MNNFRADDFDHHDLLSFANEWVALGSSIQEQVEYIMNVDPEDQDDAEVNENAIVHAKRSGVYGVCEAIDDAIDSYLEFQNTIKDAIDEENDDDDDAEVICESKRPNGNIVQLTVPPKNDGTINDIVLDIQVADEEFVVAYYCDGNYNEGPTYYTDDFDDAIATRDAMKEHEEKKGNQVTLTKSMRSHESHS